jgi:toxin ParE1/3/4
VKLRFAKEAVRNIAEIADYLLERNPSAAIRVREAIDDRLRLLLSHPRAGRLQSTAGVRKMATRKYPYLIYYTVDEERDELVVLSIAHGARERDHDDA